MKYCAILVLICVYGSQAFLFPKAKTVDNLILSKYLGRYYGVYSSLIQRKTFQKDSFCDTATYTLKADGNIKVYNAGRKSKPDGARYDANGTAEVTFNPAAFIVSFTNGAPRPSSANYLIVKVGPKTFGKDGLYEYSIVSTPRKFLCWVLARDVTEFKAKYEKEVLAYLKANGYNWFYNKPRPIYQGKDCIYPPM